MILGMDSNSKIISALLPSSPELELCRESFTTQWVNRQGSLTVRTYQEGRGVSGVQWRGFNRKVNTLSLFSPVNVAYLCRSSQMIPRLSITLDNERE